MKKQKDRGAASRTAVASMFVGFLMVGLAIPTVLVLVLANTALAKKPNPIVHRVIAGGPDACLAIYNAPHPGCDGNWSFEAIEYADGTVKGQYSDRFANGNGMHAVIDCLVVVGNRAWVSGTVTQLRIDGDDWTHTSAFLFVASVEDNGTSAGDPVDRISTTWVEDVNDIFFPGEFIGPCNDLHDPEHFLDILHDAPDGQVIVE